MSTQKIQPLTFSEYRIANGIWLQQQISKEHKHLQHHTGFYYSLYLNYLKACGLNDLLENLNRFSFNHIYSEIWPSLEEMLEVENTIHKKSILEIDMIVETYNLKY